MTCEWKLIELTEPIFIPFAWRDPTPGGQNLGRAEFQVCLKFKRGKVSEFWVYPRQTRLETYWHFSYGDIDFAISSYQRLDSVGAWLVLYCKEHKCPSICVYAPNDAAFLEISYHGLAFWRTNPQIS